MKLQSADVINALREAFNGKLRLLEDDAKKKLRLTDKKSDTLLVSDGLKVHHKKSGILYTVAAASKEEVELLTPEGEPFIVDGATFQKDYEL